MNQSIHTIDLLLYLMGPIDNVRAETRRRGHTSIEVEDTAALQINWKNGALGTMAVTMLTYPKNLEGSITILGESGSGKSVTALTIMRLIRSNSQLKISGKAIYENRISLKQLENYILES